MVRERGASRTHVVAPPDVAERVAMAPAPGEAPLPAPNAAAMLRRHGTDADIAPRPAVRFGDQVWTHGQLLEEAGRFAALYRSRLDPARPPHVAVLLDNTPDYVFALCGAALVGAALVGLNHTRRDEHLARDITYTDVQLVITEPRHQELLAPVADGLDLPGGVLMSSRFADGDDPPPTLGESLADALAALPAGASDPGDEPDIETLWALLFTSGTSAAPKAVCCSQRRLLTTGNRMTMVLGVGPDDVGYVAMPLFHSNSLMVGLAPALVAGASVGLARKFSASRFLDDVRRYGATWFNYTGKPLAYLLATPERPDDADNPLRLAYGNEGSPQVVEAVADRFGVAIVDVFGSTEGAIALDRSGGPPRGSVGRLRQGIKIVDPDGNELPPARFDADGQLENAEECVGEMVNVEGQGPFEGYYRNAEAMARTTRNGWYWSGDLGYVDPDGWVYFAGRTSDWLRVDGENFPAAPIEAIVGRHPDVILASVYGVPDVDAGDQIMVALVLRDGAEFEPAQFARWIDAQSDLSPKWRPRYVRLAQVLPTTPTNKVLTRTLVHQKFRSDRIGGDSLLVRGRGDDAYRAFTDDDERALKEAFSAAGRAQAWDL
ncbi:MAG TPA: AMP-binding protein [Acidimicrobiales bacterium]|nr:AMP-binding protein [Acidimicrobiales bacterium]